jgi:hypothetical protein
VRAEGPPTRTAVEYEGPDALREQLRLFALGPSPELLPDTLAGVHSALTKREKLLALLEGELNFHGKDSGYASHDLHAFAAKFPPQLPRAFIRGLTAPGDLVLDPMAGSGTAVVEAVLEQRRAVGVDLDPLALRLCQVKTTPSHPGKLLRGGLRVISRAAALLRDGGTIDANLKRAFDERTRAFVDYWFLPATQRELMALISAIREVSDRPTRRFLEVTFSSIIVTKSGGVSRARDLAHTRPHLVETKAPSSALEQFALRLRRNANSIAQLEAGRLAAATVGGDARRIPLADSVVDLIVTSPPYAGAIDYMRAHKFSLVWLGERLTRLSELRSRYIGSERVGRDAYAALPKHAERIVAEVAQRERAKAGVLRKYFLEMRAALSEMYRVLRPGCPAIVVVGPSVMRGVRVETHHCLADMAGQAGFDEVGVARRTLDRDKRMMPARQGGCGSSTIEQRIHEEYVIGLLKPDAAGEQADADA